MTDHTLFVNNQRAKLQLKLLKRSLNVAVRKNTRSHAAAVNSSDYIEIPLQVH